MATETVNQTAPPELFSMEARYLIAPGSTASQLMTDSSCMMASALGVLEEAFHGLTDCQWAAVYLLKQAKGMHDHAHGILIESGVIEV